MLELLAIHFYHMFFIYRLNHAIFTRPSPSFFAPQINFPVDGKLVISLIHVHFILKVNFRRVQLHLNVKCRLNLMYFFSNRHEILRLFFASKTAIWRIRASIPQHCTCHVRALLFGSIHLEQHYVAKRMEILVISCREKNLMYSLKID